jgi:outer membrane lipoprotein-sorting protein
MNIVKKTPATIFAVLLFLTGSVGAAFGLTAEEIIDRMEENQTHETGIYEGEMIITDRFGDRRSSFKVWAQGTEYTLIEFTSREEAGQKVLRTENEIYLYYPDAAETIRLQGAALRESMLGSDVSYEDMTGGKGLRDSYSFTLLEEERVDGRDCYQIEMNAKSRNVAYPKQIIWVDKEQFVMRRSHQFALSGRLLKETEVLETAEIEGLIFPVRYRITDKMKRSSGTEFRLINPQVNVPLPRGIFSLEELSW